MKKLLTLLFLLIFTVSVFAKSVTFEQAKIVFNNFLKYKNLSDYSLSNKKIITDKSKNQLAYLFQLSPDGFVAVSADDNISPIIAYSFRNKLVLDNDNLIYNMIKTDINLRLKHSPQGLVDSANKQWKNFLSNTKGLRDFQQWPAPGCTQTDGWVEKTWNQTGVFNRFCPLDGPYSRSVVGCVATAMSMIIDFHHYVGNVQFSDADDYTSGWNDEMHLDDDHEDRDYPSFPELNQYLVTLKEHYENGVPLTDDDKSALCFAAGVSTHMIYGSQGSGTWVSEVQTALLNKFGFTTADYVDDINTQFYNNLAQNMKEMKPVELAIYNSQWSNGHAIICDGYNTDNYYHLNYGWGTSDNTCWYSLPEGMPAGYSIIANAVINIEGGDEPTSVNGTVSMNENPTGTYIRLEGDKIYESYVTDNSGYFEIPAVEAGNYTLTAIKEGEHLYYASLEVDISGNTQSINVNMDQYDALQVTVSAPVNPVGTHLQIYQEEELKYSAVCNNSNGSFSIPNVLPGNYVATASLGNSYFTSQNFEVTATNQTLNVNLSEYENKFNISFHNYATAKWHLINNYTLSCGIKLSEDDILSGQPLAKVSLLAPISDDEGEIFIQLWENNTLLEEKQIYDFSAGSWIEEPFDNFYILDASKTYYIGYKINSETGDFVYYDNGPQISGKGAYFRTTSWNQVPSSIVNANFCIEAVFISQNSSQISGTISTNDNYPNLEETIIRAGNYISYANHQGEYSIPVNAGVYDVTAYLPNHIPQTIYSVSVSENQEINNIDFALQYGTQNSNDVLINPIENISVISYPNPFNFNKSKQDGIVFKTNVDLSNPKISIYNLKGQKVTSLTNFYNKQTTWKLDKKIPSGIYLYRLADDKKIVKTNKLLIIK